MARILITSGPTRQYIDPVRYLTNASSGRMGQAICAAAIRRGHDVIVVSGPVDIDYPAAAEVRHVVSTDEMMRACQQAFPSCDGAIGVAAPCDYRPLAVEKNKIQKTGGPLLLHLVETHDIIATLGKEKGNRWIVGFALETEDHHLRAMAKLERKCCDLIVLNFPEAMQSLNNDVQVLNAAGQIIAKFAGPKQKVGELIFGVIQSQLLEE